MMMVSFKSRPTCERSWMMISFFSMTKEGKGAHLDVVPLVVITTLSEEAVMNHVVDIQLVEQRVAIL